MKIDCVGLVAEHNQLETSNNSTGARKTTQPELQLELRHLEPDSLQPAEPTFAQKSACNNYML